MLVETAKAVILLAVSLTYSFWLNAICVPLFVIFNAYELFKEIIRETLLVGYCYLLQGAQKLSLNKLIRHTMNWLKRFKTAIYSDVQQPRNSLLRQSRSQEQITATFMRAAASPDEITENEKVLMLMQKMRKLEETIFQESNDRRKAETELFEVKTQLQEKNAELTKERSQCVENMNKISVLKFQVCEKNDLLEKSTSYVAELESEVKGLKERIEQLLEQKATQTNAERGREIKIPELQMTGESVDE